MASWIDNMQEEKTSWLVGEMVDHVGSCSFKAAQDAPAFNIRLGSYDYVLSGMESGRCAV